MTVIETMLGNNHACSRLTKHKVTQKIDFFNGCMLYHKLLLRFFLVANASYIVEAGIDREMKALWLARSVLSGV